MTNPRESLNVIMELVAFVTRYYQVLGKQLVASQQTMAETVHTVMDAIHKLSDTTEARKKEAEQALEQTYLNPDAATTDLVSSIQSSVDDVFEQATASMNGNSQVALAPRAASSTEDSDRLRRFGGQFSKHMESLSTLDDSVKSMLFSMMGALSSDDVIHQRLEHVAMAIAAANVGLNYLLVDFDKRFTPENVSKFKSDLLGYTMRSYTMEDERELFAAAFPTVDPARKAG